MKQIRRLKNTKVVVWAMATKKRKIATVIAMALLAFLSFQKLTKPDWELEVTTASNQTLVESVSSSGNITAEKFVELSFLSAENIQNIVVDDNSYVSKGQVIAYLNTTSLVHSLAQAEAGLRAREATLEAVYDDLKGKDTTETFDEKATRTTAEVTKDQAYDAVIIARKNLSNATIRAPFDGIVTFKDGTSEGKYSSPIMPAFIIVDPSTLYFVAELNELEIPKIKSGTLVEITLDAYPDDTINAEVESIGFVSVVSSTGGTAYRVRITFPQFSDNRLRVGMNGDAEFILSKSEGVLTVPQTALVEDGESIYVWTVEGGRAKKVQIEIGTSSINDIEVLSGITPGTKVIARPPADIAEGDRIKSI